MKSAILGFLILIAAGLIVGAMFLCNNPINQKCTCTLNGACTCDVCKCCNDKCCSPSCPNKEK